MGMSVVADDMAQIGTVLAATAAVAFVLSHGRNPSAAPGTHLRQAGLLLASVLFGVHTVLARWVAVGTFPARADLPVLAWMLGHRTTPLTWLFTEVSAVGGTVGMTVLATVAAVVFWLRHRRREALGMVGGALGAPLLVVGFKNLYGRSRPPLDVQLVPQSSLSFPSGHALGSIVVVGLLAVLVVSGLRSPAVRGLVAVTAVAVVALIGSSRLYLGVHWLSDVLAGWLLGGAWLALCAAIVLPGRPGTGPEGTRSGTDHPPVGGSDEVPVLSVEDTTNATKERCP